MFSPLILFIVVIGYVSLLFGLGYYAETREKTGRSIVSNPYVYSLSLAVYCTSWTFYGSVGKAAGSGLSFITTYIGPTLIAALWWVVLRKVVVTARRNGITTISDFIGARYGSSLTVTAIVAVIALVGIAPYIGLQIKAITSTFWIMTGGEVGSQMIGWLTALLMGVFAIIFGARRLDATERHEGLVFAVAFESTVKFAAFLSVGVFVTYGLFGGFGDVFEKAHAAGYGGLMKIGGEGAGVSFMQWASLTVLSMCAIMFLPRQFHVAVVENHDVRHIRKAMWLFPLYLLLINVFVLPVALGGLLLGGDASQADTFVLSIPLHEGSGFLALLVFIGGFSAATSMIIVESLALSTMAMNGLIMPFIVRFGKSPRFPSLVLNTKRLVIIGCVMLGYFFAVSIGEYYSLVDMGLKSFEAVSIFAPAFLIGLYWKRGNAKGAAAGLVAGFAVWLYTLLLPAFARAGLLDETGMLGALFSSKALDPHALFGVTGMDKWTNSLFWGMLLNAGLYVGVSIFTSQRPQEVRRALSFVDSYVPAGAGATAGPEGVRELLSGYIGREEAVEAVDGYMSSRGLGGSGMDEPDMAGLMEEAERRLSGSLGPAMAAMIMDKNTVMDERLTGPIREMSQNLTLSRKELAEANSSLSALREFSQNIIESMPVGIATLDGRMRVTSWNRGMEKITGVSRASAIDKDLLTLGLELPGDVLERAVGPGGYVHELRRADKAVINITVTPFADPKGGYVVIFDDVTEKTRKDRELLLASKFAGIGRLTAGVSHEIGNPLASISSLVQEIQAVGSPEFTSEALGTVNRHIERIVRIVRGLGDFARVGGTDRIPADLAKVFEDTQALISVDKRFRKVELVREVSGAPNVRVNVDQFQQVFLNLLLNSLDAMPEGGRIFFGMRKDGGDLEITYSDTGEGMDKDALDKIFDPFFTTKPPGKGTGLGMSVCYGIIADHGGTIRVESEPGRGTEFIIRLPMEDR